MRKVFATLAACALAMLGLAAPAHAATTTVDFESLTGPSLFSAADAPVVDGLATFTGGQILTATANLPANQTTVYGTAYVCVGCAPTLTIDFAVPVNDVSMQVMNGWVTTVSYTVESDTGEQVTKELPANALSGADYFTLTDKGVVQVQVRETTPSTTWDFFIDNISFAPWPTQVSECKQGGWESYGVFKNQGDCVSYVVTHGRNLPQG